MALIFKAKIMTIKSTLLLALALVLFSKTLSAQADSTKAAKTENTKPEASPQDKKRKENGFIVYGGVSANDITGSSTVYNSTISPGFMLGASYKSGRFFYWQLGFRYNNAVYELDTIGIPIDSSTIEDNVFSVRDIDMPLSVGINLLSAIDRLFALRIYASAIPAYTFGVGSNDYGITASDLNAFNIYGQAGIGIDITFFVIDIGYNYGFKDVFKNTASNPGQAYLTLGFRF
jgi:hypothetical protein